MASLATGNAGKPPPCASPPACRGMKFSRRSQGRGVGVERGALRWPWGGGSGREVVLDGTRGPARGDFASEAPPANERDAPEALPGDGIGRVVEEELRDRFGGLGLADAGHARLSLRTRSDRQRLVSLAVQARDLGSSAELYRVR